MFSLQLLGGLSLDGNGNGSGGRGAQRKRLALLAVLARAPRNTATRDRLIGLLWPECTTEEARHRLSSAIYDLRRTLGSEAVTSRGDDVILDPALLEIDTQRFEAAVQGGRWEEAVARYWGPFLDGVYLDHAEAFDEWVAGERDRLRRLFERAREAAAALPVQPVPAASPELSIPVVAPARTPRKRRWWLYAAAALTIVTGVGGMLLLRQSVRPANGPVRVAIFPFRSIGQPAIANLSHGLVDLMSLALDGAGELRTVDPASALAGLGDQSELSADAARERARRLGATHYVLGTVAAEPDRLRLRAMLYAAASGDVEAQASADGSPDRVLALVDQLSAGLLADRLRTSRDRLARAAAVSTGSLPALKLWLAGEAAFRRGDYGAAAERFENATTEDSGFALAHYRHSLATLWGDRPGASTDRHDTLALRFAARLGPRDRQLVAAYSAWRRGDPAQAEYLYRRILASWPDDVEAWQQLGETLFHYNAFRGRPLAEARPAFERVLDFDPEHRGARWHLALLDALAGRSAAVARALEQLTASPDVSQAPTESEGLRVALQPAAGSARDSLLRASDESLLAPLADHLGVFVGDLGGAERIARLLVEPQRNDYARATGRVLLAELDLARGRLRDARLELARAPFQTAGMDATLARSGALLNWWIPAPRDLVRAALAALSDGESRGLPTRIPRAQLQALLELELGNLERVRQVAAELEQDSVDSVAGGEMGRMIRAYLAARGGRPEEVLQLLDELGPPGWFGLLVSGAWRGDPLPRFVRAEALFALGRDREAFDWYGTFSEHDLRDLVYAAPAEFRRGEILERQGQAEAARSHFARVVELWSGADPELMPWVRSARLRLSGWGNGAKVISRPASSISSR